MRYELARKAWPAKRSVESLDELLQQLHRVSNALNATGHLRFSTVPRPASMAPVGADRG